MRPIQYIAFLFSLGSLFFTIQRCHKAQDLSWSEDNQNAFHDKLYSTAKFKFRTEEDWQAYADCGLEKAKAALPYGIGSKPDDSVKAIFVNIDRSCTEEIRQQSGESFWTPEMEKSAKAYILALPTWKNTDPKIKEEICTCYIQDVKATYPDGVLDSTFKNKTQLIFKNCTLKTLKKEKKHIINTATS